MVDCAPAHVNHKYGDTVEDTVRKFEYDGRHICPMFVDLDTYITFRAIEVTLRSRGAH